MKRLLHWGPLLALFIMKFVSLTTMIAMGKFRSVFIQFNYNLNSIFEFHFFNFIFVKHFI